MAETYLSPLDKWMKLNRYSDPAFAKAVSEHLEKPIGHRAVFKWRHKKRVPRAKAQAAIAVVTGNAVMPNDFIETDGPHVEAA